MHETALTEIAVAAGRGDERAAAELIRSTHREVRRLLVTLCPPAEVEDLTQETYLRARHARVSARTLTRRFREQTGSTPLGWLHEQRLLLARRLLESTDLPVTAVAQRSGHGSVTALRAHFQRELQTSPDRYRRSFGGPA